MEKILVCVSNMEFAEGLIKRGKRIAEAFNTECTVLHIENSHYNEYNYGEYENHTVLKKMCASYDCSFRFITKEKKRVSETISYVAKEQGVTQIVIGQPNVSKWSLLTKGSLVQELFGLLEGIDLHIVEVHKEKAETAEIHYEIGVDAFLVADNGEYRLITEDQASKTFKGIFYKELATDFQNGIFKTYLFDHEVLVRIKDGVVMPMDMCHLEK